jgi:methylglutaconyl-CoA hydratase
LGLLHEVVQDDGTGIATDVAVRRCLNDLLAGAPEAQALCKTMIRDWGHLSLTEDLKEQTIRLIADTRSGEEAQQGFKAFFAKKDAPWVQKV